MNAKLRIALGAPLIGLVLTWSLFFIGSFVQAQNNGDWQQNRAINWGIYYFLAGIAVFAAGSVYAFRVSDVEVSAKKTKAAQAVLKFAGFGVVLSAVAGAIFAFILFTGSLASDNPYKLVESYIPIILIAGVVVVSILQATVWRKSQAEPGAPADPRKRALALAWVVPIIGTAFALIVGLLSYSGNPNVSVWVWVITLSIILASVLIGTHFASVARGLVKVEVRDNTVEIGGGANRLNFVLAVVFGAVVNFVAFGTGMGAASGIFNYSYDDEGNQIATSAGFSADWWANQFVPSLVFLLLAQVAVYISVSMRHRNAE